MVREHAHPRPEIAISHVHPMKLLIFIHSLGSGGAERVAVNLANHWAASHWPITIVTMGPINWDFYELHPAIRRIAFNMVDVSANPCIGLCWNLRRIFALRRILRRIRPDVALSLMTTANVLLAFAAWGLPGLRMVGSEHIHPPQCRLSPLWESLRRHAYGHLSAVTALTRESAAWLDANTSGRRIRVIPNPAPWPLPNQAPRLSPDSVIPSGRRVLLAVGRLEAQKGFDFLIKAYSALARHYPDWDLVILGEGTLRSDLHGRVRAQGLEGRIFLPGTAGNIREWYERADLFVMSSRFEGFPMTLAEAQAHGLPAVSFDCDTGPRDIIRHEVDGLLVPPEDMDALATALGRLMGDEGLRHRFAERAVEARQRFSIEGIAARWEALFEEVSCVSSPGGTVHGDQHE